MHSPHGGEENVMLLLKPSCECCDRDLPPASTEALICSYECTWCRTCADEVLAGTCPNCGGDLQPRPIRPPAMLEVDPASTERVVAADGPCAARRAAG
jgi:uncharacterized protein